MVGRLVWSLRSTDGGETGKVTLTVFSSDLLPLPPPAAQTDKKGEKKFPSKSRARPTTGHYPQKSEAPKTLFFWFFFFASRGATKLSLLFGEGGYFFLQFASFFTGLVYKVLLCHTKKGALQYVDLDIMHRYHQLSFEKEDISSIFTLPQNFPEFTFSLPKKLLFPFSFFSIVGSPIPSTRGGKVRKGGGRERREGETEQSASSSFSSFPLSAA